MSRSQNILGKVLRNLKRHGVTESQVQNEEIYSELSAAQNNIISNSNFDKVIKLTLVNGVDTYRLSTSPDIDNLDDSMDVEEIMEAVEDYVADERRLNISSVKAIKSSWRGSFEVISNQEFAQITSLITSYSKPRVATFIDNKIKIFRIPTVEDVGKTIEFYVSLNSSTRDINEDTSPEIPEVFDKCLEAFATAQFLGGADRTQWLTEYNFEVKRLSPSVTRKNPPLERPSIWGERGCGDRWWTND